jgi:hypothetical protein
VSKKNASPGAPGSNPGAEDAASASAEAEAARRNASPQSTNKRARADAVKHPFETSVFVADSLVDVSVSSSSSSSAALYFSDAAAASDAASDAETANARADDAFFAD